MKWSMPLGMKQYHGRRVKRDEDFFNLFFFYIAQQQILTSDCLLVNKEKV